MSTEPAILRYLFKSSERLSAGTCINYCGYTLKKSGGGVSSSEHTEWAILNRDGTKVESLTTNAFDTFDTFQSRVDKIIEYDPDTIEDWLNRNAPDDSSNNQENEEV